MFFQDDVFYDDNDPFQSLNEGELKVDREFELGPGFTEQQKQQLLFEEDNARMAAQRKQEVNQIVSSIADLNYIFKDLGRMVAEQVNYPSGCVLLYWNPLLICIFIGYSFRSYRLQYRTNANSSQTRLPRTRQSGSLPKEES